MPIESPRRHIEREVETLIDSYGIEGILHALVETCHQHNRQRLVRWQFLCSMLTLTEQYVTTHGL